MSEKKLSKKDKIQIWSEVENEGLGYWCQNYGSEYLETEIGPLLLLVRVSLNKLDKIISSFEEFVNEEGP